MKAALTFAAIMLASPAMASDPSRFMTIYAPGIENCAQILSGPKQDQAIGWVAGFVSGRPMGELPASERQWGHDINVLIDMVRAECRNNPADLMGATGAVLNRFRKAQQ
jgi:hypothetical protein